MIFAAFAIDHLTAAEGWPYLLMAALVLAVLALSARAARSEAFAARAAVVLNALRLRTRPRRPSDEARAVGAEWHAAAMEIVGSRAARARLAAVSAAAVVADATILWCATRGAGIDVAFDVALLAMAIGTVSTWIPLLPAGLGVVEAAVPAVLHHFGAQYSAGLAATVVYRAAQAVLPAAAGVLILPSLRRSPK